MGNLLLREWVYYQSAMCLIAIAHRAHRDFPLLIAANRDEFHERPAAASCFWETAPDLLAGQDLRAGGTWMGISRQGRFAAITNHRNPPDTPPEPRSRGLLTLDYLLGTIPARAYLQQLLPTAADYAGFNLVLGEPGQLWYFSNIEQQVVELVPGVYGLSNTTLDSRWPKQERARLAMTRLLGQPVDHRRLRGTVACRKPVPDADLPDTGVGLEMERLLAPQFIVGPDYGTRSTTSMWQDRTGVVSWEENTCDRDGRLMNCRQFRFRLEAGDTPDGK